MQSVEFNWAQRAWLTGPYADALDLRWRHECGFRMRVSSGLSSGRVREVLEAIAQRHRLLRTITVVGPDGEVRQYAGDVAVATEMIVLEGMRDAEASVFARLADLIGQNYPLNLAAVLIHGDGATSHLYLMGSHFYLDGAAMAILRAEIVSALDPHGAKSVPPDPSRHDEIVRYEHSPAAIRRSEQNIKHLGELATEARRSDVMDAYQLSSQCLIGRVESALLFRATRLLERRYRTSTASVLLAVFLIAYAKLAGRSRAWLAVCSSNRVLPFEVDYLGLQTRTGFMLADLDPRLDFAEFLRAAAVGLVASVQSARHDPDLQVADFRRRGFTAGPQLFFNAALSAPADPAPGREVRSTGFAEPVWSAGPAGRYALEANFSVERDLLGVTVEFDPGVFAPAAVAGLVRDMDSIGQILTDRPDSCSIGDVLAAMAAEN